MNQVPAAELPDHLWDVLVAGAGPAGATTASHLARMGHRVLLVEREAFPRDKTCGDNLLPDALAALGRLGLLDEVRAAGHRVGDASIFSPSGIEVHLPGEYLTVRRRTLDALLVRSACRAGAVFSRGEVRTVASDGERRISAHVDGAVTPLRARVAVFATGARGLLSPSGRTARRPGRTAAVALRCYVRSDNPLDRMVVAYRRPLLPGYAWIFPMGNGAYNVGCGLFDRGTRLPRVNLADAFRAFTREFPLARALIESGTPLTRLAGARLGCGLGGDPLPGGPNILAVGEALGATYPLTGEGVGKAMETGEFAAATIDEALTRGDARALGRYARKIAALRRRYGAYEKAARWLSHPWLGDFLAGRIRRSGYLRSTAARVLSDEADPRKIFSLGGVLRSFLA